MDANAHGGGQDQAENPARAPHGLQRSWSVERLIELLDGAIDTAGAQLARSAGLWDDTPDEARARRESRRLGRRAASQSAATTSFADDLPAVHELEL